MAIVLMNPTNEKMKQAYDGIDYTVEPGQKIRANDKMARHLLHKLHDIGLCRLDYGDESREEEIAEDGRQRFKQFKLLQISRYNEDNFLRSQTKRLPLRPTKQLQRWADELGETLYNGLPINKTDEQERHSKIWEEKEALRHENEKLRGKVESMEGKLDLLLSKMGAMGEHRANEQLKVEAGKEAEAEAINDKREWIKNLKGSQMRAMMKEAPDDYLALPIQIQEEFRDKWRRVMDEPFPL